MWKLSPDSIDPALRATGATVLSAILAQCLSSRQWELESEALAWTILLVLFGLSNPPGILGLVKGSSSQDQSTIPATRTLWVIAAGITSCSFFRTENNLSAALAALTPLVLVPREEEPDSLDKCPPKAQPLVKTQWWTILSIFFAVLTLAKWQTRRVALAFAPAALLITLHAALSYRRTSKSHTAHNNDTLQGSFLHLSSRTMAMLVILICIQYYRFGLSIYNVVPLLSIAIVKAILWYFALQSTRYVTWNVVPIVVALALTSTQSPSMQHSEMLAISHVGATLILLSRLVNALATHSRLRSALWILVIIPVYPYLVNVSTIRVVQLAAERFNTYQQHPVEALAHRGRQKLADLTNKQSKTYKDAVDEYIRRYRIDPPPGFQAWYDFATSHQSPIIDDYDMIHEAVSPFWKLTGEEFLQTMQQALNIPNIELWTCSFTTGSQTECTHPHRSNDRHFGLLFNNLVKDSHGKLPNMTVLVNHLDEPRVLWPPSSLTLENPHEGRTIKMTDLSSRSSWDEVTKYCGHRKRDVGIGDEKTPPKTFGLPFITDPFAAKNLCEHLEYKSMHGLLVSPVTFKEIEGLVPVLSTGALSTMGDILIPSPAYIESDFEYNDKDDVDWERKRNSLYWVGSSTGGVAHKDSQWQSFHRQRFVAFAQNLRGGHQGFYYLRLINDVTSLVKSWFLNGRLIDVAFSQIFNCEAKYCREQSLYFNVGAWAYKNDAFRSRLVFDLDGNGISGRYYKLLASKSTPLKQTLLREWHDERLIPWVHYVPVSQSMEELPELITYLTSTRSGQQVAREISEQGREWYFKALRGADLNVYNYRLLLELARLQDPKREVHLEPS